MTKYGEEVLKKLELTEKSKMVQAAVAYMLVMAIKEESYFSPAKDDNPEFGGELGRKLHELGFVPCNSYHLIKDWARRIVFDDADWNTFEVQIVDLASHWSNDLTDRLEAETGIGNIWDKLKTAVDEFMADEEFLPLIMKLKEDAENNKGTRKK